MKMCSDIVKMQNKIIIIVWKKEYCEMEMDKGSKMVTMKERRRGS